jgi:hypothetical protein
MKSSVEEPTVLEMRNPCEMRSMDKGPRPNEAPRPNEMPGPKHARSTHVEPTHVANGLQEANEVAVRISNSKLTNANLMTIAPIPPFFNWKKTLLACRSDDCV